MRGGAQAHLLEADDGQFYIVKFQNNPQHRRILVNEFLAAGILEHLQITSPSCEIVRLSADFLAANPDVSLQTGTRQLAVEPGWHFGSRHPGHPDTMAIYDFIPDVLLNQVANAPHFLRILMRLPTPLGVGERRRAARLFTSGPTSATTGSPASGVPPRKARLFVGDDDRPWLRL